MVALEQDFLRNPASVELLEQNVSNNMLKLDTRTSPAGHGAPKGNVGNQVATKILKLKGFPISASCKNLFIRTGYLLPYSSGIFTIKDCPDRSFIDCEFTTNL